MASPLLPAPDPRRVVGVDVARALALLGMMATHLLPGIVGTHVPWPQLLAGGRASALFAVLAGVSVSLVSGRDVPVGELARYAVSVRLAVRAALVGALGLLLGLVPSGIAVILAYYAVLFVLGLPFLGRRAHELAAIAVAWVVCVPVISMWLRPHLPARDSGSPTPGDLLHPGQLAIELSFTGYYPAVTWLAYLLAGMAIGRSDLRRVRTAVALLVGGATLACTAVLLSRWLLARPGAREALLRTYGEDLSPERLDAQLAHGLHGTTPTGSSWWLATVAPHSGTPLDLAQTTGSAMAVLGLCLLLTRAAPRAWAALFGAGAMTLSLYTLHVLVMGRGWWPDLEQPQDYADQVLLVLGVGAFFALVPLRGPLETVVARVSTGAAHRLTGEPTAKPATRHTG